MKKNYTGGPDILALLGNRRKLVSKRISRTFPVFGVNSSPALYEGLNPATDLRPEVAIDFAELEEGLLVEAIEDPSDPARSIFAVYDGTAARCETRLEQVDRIFVPITRRRGPFAHVRLAKGSAPYGSLQALCTATFNLFRQCLDIDIERAWQLTFFTLSTWLVEKLPIAPYLALVGLPRSGKTTALRLIGMLCRRGILVENFTAASLYQLYDHLTPTLLIDETQTVAQRRELFHLLRSGSTPGFTALRMNGASKCYGPKVVTWTELPNDAALNSRCIIVPLHESERTDLKRLNDPTVLAAADDLQRQFLQFRLEKFKALDGATVPVATNLCSRARDLYEALALPIAEDPEMCKVLAISMNSQEQFTRAPLSVKQAAVLAAVFKEMHRDSPISYIRALANAANLALEKQGEVDRLTARAAGEVLTSFGIGSRFRTHRGWTLLLDRALQVQVHQIVQRHSVDGHRLLLNLAPKPSETCSLCGDLPKKSGVDAA